MVPLVVNGRQAVVQSSASLDILQRGMRITDRCPLEVGRIAYSVQNSGMLKSVALLYFQQCQLATEYRYQLSIYAQKSTKLF